MIFGCYFQAWYIVPWGRSYFCHFFRFFRDLNFTLNGIF
jgi:hypothetical protein